MLSHRRTRVVVLHPLAGEGVPGHVLRDTGSDTTRTGASPRTPLFSPATRLLQQALCSRVQRARNFCVGRPAERFWSHGGDKLAAVSALGAWLAHRVLKAAACHCLVLVRRANGARLTHCVLVGRAHLDTVGVLPACRAPLAHRLEVANRLKPVLARRAAAAFLASLVVKVSGCASRACCGRSRCCCGSCCCRCGDGRRCCRRRGYSDRCRACGPCCRRRCQRPTPLHQAITACVQHCVEQARYEPAPARGHGQESTRHVFRFARGIAVLPRALS